MNRWVMTMAVEFLDEKDRLYVQAILVPTGTWSAELGMDQSANRRPSPREVHLDRGLRRLARELQKNLEATIVRVGSQGSWGRARNLLHRQIIRTRPRIRRRRLGFWGRQELSSFLQDHNATMRLLQMSAAAGKVRVPSAFHPKDIYWEVPDLDPEQPKQKRSKP